MAALSSLEARIAKLEGLSDPAPALITVFQGREETENDARARTLAQLGVSDRGALCIVTIAHEDANL